MVGTVGLLVVVVVVVVPYRYITMPACNYLLPAPAWETLGTLLPENFVFWALPAAGLDTLSELGRK